MPHVVLSNQFDSNSNRTQLSATIGGVADFLNSYSYDALNELTQLYQQGQPGGNAVATKGANLTYNALGQLATIARTNYFGTGPAPDIATSTFSYDGANRLTEIANTTNGGTAIDAYSWTYDAADRVTSMTTTTDGTATYSYDNTNQVTGASYTANAGATQPANESYSYDSNGNRTNTGYSTGTNNQLASDGTFNYTYDHEGNRSTRTRISNDPANDYLTTYTWDYRDRLTDVNFYNNSNVLTKHVHYTYDVFDHLIGKQVDDTGGGSYDRAEFYVYDGNDVVLHFDGSGALTERYLNGPSASGVDTVLAEEDVTSLSSPGTVTWPLTDNLGTVRDIVDSTGTVIDHLVYNSFGQIASESNASIHHLQGYAGGILDADTGMVNDWHRWYDPTVGRWISEDPMEFAAGDANLSRYVGNDVEDAIDANGLAQKRTWEDPAKGWRFGIDRGPEIKNGGFEIHVYKNGEEVAKITGRGGWCDKHGGRPLPLSPSKFKEKYPDMYKELRKTLRRQTKASIKLGWASGRAVGSVLTLLALGAEACGSLDAVANGAGYRRMMYALQHDDLDGANAGANEIYLELLADAGSSKIALQWKVAWAELQEQNKLESLKED